MNESTGTPDLPETATQAVTLEDAVQIAMRLHQDDQYESAEEIYRQILELAPDNPDILHFFGMLRHQRGYSEEGVESIKKALEIAPDYVDAQNNLGNIYLHIGQPGLAAPCYRRVIELNPDFVPAYANIGVALKELEFFHEAVEYLRKAIEFEPDNASFHQNLGNVYLNMKQYPEAVGEYRKSLALKPFNAEAYEKLGRAFYIMGEIERCVEVLNQWLEHDPENPLARHMYAAYTSSNTPPRASDAYVRRIFDSFAASFDGVLKNLDYQAPFLVHTALRNLEPSPDTWRILDAGCGTGLCGALVRSLVKHLAGVDLSPKMLERAKARGVYDELSESELTAFFAQTQSTYHAITCVDTFCYFGDLSGAMLAAANALKPEGWFIFTLEKLDESHSVEDFRLNVHGRYSHTEVYIRQVLSDAGLRVEAIETAVLRKERGEQVAGLVVTAQLP